jgi:hypothetical protein
VWDTHVFRVGGVESAEKYQALKDEHGRRSPPNDAAYDSFAPASGGHPPSSMMPPSVNVASARPLNLRREFALVLSRIGLVAFTAVISIVFPNFGLIVALVGSFSNSAIAFILPQIFYIQLVLKPEAARTGTNNAPDVWSRYSAFLLPYLIIVLGICASIIGVYTTIHAMVTGDDS